MTNSVPTRRVSDLRCMLGAARRATEGGALGREAGWRDWSPAFMVGGQVTGKRFGIIGMGRVGQVAAKRARGFRSEEPTSELQSLMRISYAVFCLKKTKMKTVSRHSL